MTVIKKFGLLIGAGISLILAILFAFVIGFPSGVDGVTVSQPFAGGVWSKALDVHEYLQALETSRASAGALATLSIVFLLLAIALAVVFFVLRARANKPVVATMTASVPCPFCAEPIQAAAKVCKHCNKTLTSNA